ncbi:MAG: (4Fe-4S)-binding protein [Candidatus Hydrothermota bacterium]|nr:MAG: (4Fe-4S)-binding protein [Candidatus Hydrothermae bacterium]
MIISIASGKGGTGKTTVATNLVLSIDNAQFIDCDVEEPNANIFLKADIDSRENVTVDIPKIDEEKCDYCGKCSEFCEYNALAVVPSKILVFPELCHSCGGCELVCPRNAVGWRQKVVGKVEHGTAQSVDFYHGLLDVGEIQTMPVIKTLKQKVDNSKNVILDAPPGTSCPVIETIQGSDYCILVTEPTPFGLHDLKLMVNVVRYMNIPFGVIINREGVGDTNVEMFCRREKIPVLMKIPHDEEISKLYSKGVPFVMEQQLWRDKFKWLFSKIKEEVKK